MTVGTWAPSALVINDEIFNKILTVRRAVFVRQNKHLFTRTLKITLHSITMSAKKSGKFIEGDIKVTRT
jgi:hypothetical protein